MFSVVLSKNGIPIRLTHERWAHIVEEHSELAGLRAEVLEVVVQPLKIVAGNGGELLALAESERGKWLVVAYKEVEHDGFIITAFLTTRTASLDRREQIWPP